ncbi:type IX secretion system sortase PorU [Sediminitomix flava]|uniref:Peptidase C25-like protein n=1 Tax=Sediminitomix flava TaxID=379075 RepID=A0A315Z759_SEDFL|nr:type IX secretion system sortase PorU [Sediminitomix flava]PWJ39371.1 peptidase C25-like protein [Sediminitomix flava]
MWKSILVLFLFVILQSQSILKAQSVLADGDVYKFRVTSSQLYKLDYNDLLNLGINVSTLDPKKIQVFGNTGGMLPQENAAFRYNDLFENAIYIEGEEDGSFDTGDYILFYAQGAHKEYFDESDQLLKHEFNCYDDANFIYLKIGESDGKRITETEQIELAGNEISTFDDLHFYEEDEVYPMLESTGRRWFSFYYSSTQDSEHTFSIPGRIPSEKIKLTTAVLSKAESRATFTFSIDGSEVDTVSVAGTTPNKYYRQGYIVGKTMQAEGNYGETFTIGVNYNRPTSSAKGYLDYLSINTKRELKLYDNYVHFRSITSLNEEQVIYRIQGLEGNNAQIWDISNPLEPKSIPFSSSRFSDFPNGSLKEYIAFSGSSFPSPAFENKVVQQNIHGSSVPDFIILTHPNFLSEANRLADFRRMNDQLDVLVVTTEQVYNEFSSGRQDVTAIRDLVRYFYLQDQSKLKYLLLVGDGTYDFKNTLKESTFVPVYESRETLYPVNSFCSDDYFGMMDEHEGYWAETLDGEVDLDDMEIGVGRLPVSTLEETEAIVSKIIYYETQESLAGNWKKNILFVADDVDGNLHQEDADKLGVLTDSHFPHIDAKRLMLDDFEKTPTPSGSESKEAEAFLYRQIHDGVLIVNYNGHGNVAGWSAKRILTSSHIDTWTNLDRLPLMVTATCDFGRFDDPYVFSGAEKAILKSDGGAIALLTTTRPVFQISNYEINEVFIENVFELEKSGEMARLGDVMRKTKNEGIYSDNNRNFSLLGDPTLRLRFPKKQIQLTSINENSVSGENIVGALERVVLEGQVQVADAEVIRTDFNGELLLSVFSRKERQTKGIDSPVYPYETMDNVLFRGWVSVVDGEFEASFVVPKDIYYSEENLKISMYATTTGDQLEEVSGTFTDLKLGGTAQEPVIDDESPSIALFMEDDSFVEGSVVGSDSYMFAELEDNIGFNTSLIGVGHEMLLTLDDDSSWVVNDYFEASLDQPNKGTILFPLKGLEKGVHTLKLKVWDVGNNSAESTITFRVADNSEFVVENFKSYPNPISFSFQNPKLTFNHNQAGEDILVNVKILKMSGEVASKFETEISNAAAIVENLEWESQKLRPGVYILVANLMVKGTELNSQKVFKIIVGD